MDWPAHRFIPRCYWHLWRSQHNFFQGRAERRYTLRTWWVSLFKYLQIILVCTTLCLLRHFYHWVLKNCFFLCCIFCKWWRCYGQGTLRVRESVFVNTGLSPLHKWPQLWSFLCLWICPTAVFPNLGPVISSRDLKKATSAVASTSWNIQISNSLLHL